MRLHFLCRFIHSAEHSIHRIQINWQRYFFAARQQRPYLVQIRHKFAEFCYPVDNFQIFGMEKMRPISMHPYPILIPVVIRIPANMRALINHPHLVPSLRQLPSMHRPRKPRAHHEYRFHATNASP